MRVMMAAQIGDNGGPPIAEENPWERDGYVKIARGMREHPIVGFGKTVSPAEQSRGFCYSRAEAWQDLIMECRYTPGQVINKGRKMDIKPGQLLGAISWLAYRWNWTPKTVRWFLDQLQADHMISRSDPTHEGLLDENMGSSDGSIERLKQGKQKGNQVSVLSVCNYEIYQLALQAQRQAKGQANGKPTASEGQANGNTLIKEEGNTVRSSVVSATPIFEPPSDPLPASGEAWMGDTGQLVRRLMEAAKPVLDNPANCSGLLTAAVPIVWLRQSCDLELDILETVKAIAKKQAGKKRVNSWGYFTEAIFEARDRRLSMYRPPPKRPPPGLSPDGLSLEEIDRRDMEDALAVQAQWSRGSGR